MSFVLDASVVLAWLLPDERSVAAEQIIQRLSSVQGFAPSLLPFEVTNALVMATRRQRLTEPDRGQLQALINSLPLRIDSVNEAALALSVALYS